MRSAPGSSYSINLSELVASSLVAFDWLEEDHPRDEHGRFTSGGGAPPSETMPTRPPTVTDLDNAQARGRNILDKDPRGGASDVSTEERSAAKAAIASAISKDMTASTDEIMRAGFVPGAYLKEDYEKAVENPDGFVVVKNGDGTLDIYSNEQRGRMEQILGDRAAPSIAFASDEGQQILREHAVSTLVHNWAQSSNDDHAASLAIQHAVEVEFGITDAQPWTASLAQQQTAAESMYAHHGDVYREFVRTQYDHTQAYLKEKGITEVTLVRGFEWNLARDTVPDWTFNTGSETTVDVPLRPLSSWSSDPEAAQSFGNSLLIEGKFESVGAQIAATFPAERIFSTARTGFGALIEDEFVPLGGVARAELLVPVAESRERLRELTAAAAPTPPYDSATRNEDWLRTIGWDLPEDAETLKRMGIDLAEMAKLPAGEAMPALLRALVASSPRIDLSALVREAFEWDEDEHPRDERGRFGSKGGGSDTFLTRLDDDKNVGYNPRVAEAAVRAAADYTPNDPYPDGEEFGNYADVERDPETGEALLPDTWQPGSVEALSQSVSDWQSTFSTSKDMQIAADELLGYRGEDIPRNDQTYAEAAEMLSAMAGNAPTGAVSAYSFPDEMSGPDDNDYVHTYVNDDPGALVRGVNDQGGEIEDALRAAHESGGTISWSVGSFVMGGDIGVTREERMAEQSGDERSPIVDFETGEERYQTGNEDAAEKALRFTNPNQNGTYGYAPILIQATGTALNVDGTYEAVMGGKFVVEDIRTATAAEMSNWEARPPGRGAEPSPIIVATLRQVENVRYPPESLAAAAGPVDTYIHWRDGSLPRPALTASAVAFEWNEEDHPRDEKGRFGEKDGGSEAERKYLTRIGEDERLDDVDQPAASEALALAQQYDPGARLPGDAYAGNPYSHASDVTTFSPGLQDEDGEPLDAPDHWEPGTGWALGQAAGDWQGTFEDAQSIQAGADALLGHPGAGFQDDPSEAGSIAEAHELLNAMAGRGPDGIAAPTKDDEEFGSFIHTYEVTEYGDLVRGYSDPDGELEAAFREAHDTGGTVSWSIASFVPGGAMGEERQAYKKDIIGEDPERIVDPETGEERPQTGTESALEHAYRFTARGDYYAPEGTALLIRAVGTGLTLDGMFETVMGGEFKVENIRPATEHELQVIGYTEMRETGTEPSPIPHIVDVRQVANVDPPPITPREQLAAAGGKAKHFYFHFRDGSVYPSTGLTAAVAFEYDPDQPRDETGKWSKEGGGGSDGVYVTRVGPDSPLIGDPEVTQRALDKADLYLDAEAPYREHTWRLVADYRGEDGFPKEVPKEWEPGTVASLSEAETTWQSSFADTKGIQIAADEILGHAAPSPGFPTTSPENAAHAYELLNAMAGNGPEGAISGFWNGDRTTRNLTAEQRGGGLVDFGKDELMRGVDDKNGELRAAFEEAHRTGGTVSWSMMSFLQGGERAQDRLNKEAAFENLNIPYRRAQDDTARQAVEFSVWGTGVGTISEARGEQPMLIMAEGRALDLDRNREAILGGTFAVEEVRNLTEDERGRWISQGTREMPVRQGQRSDEPLGDVTLVRVRQVEGIQLPKEAALVSAAPKSSYITVFGSHREAYDAGALTAAGDFDEDEHPRDAHGRFASKDESGAEAEDSIAPGWKEIEGGESSRELIGLLHARGLSDAEIEVALRELRPPDIYAEYTGPGGMHVMFTGDPYDVTPEQQTAFLEQATALQRDFPREDMTIRIDNEAFDPGIQIDRSGTKAFPDQMLGQLDLHTGGMTVIGSNIITISPSQFSAEAQETMDSEPGWHSPNGPADNAAYTLVHEWGHTVDRVTGSTHRDMTRSTTLGNEFQREFNEDTSRDLVYGPSLTEMLPSQYAAESQPEAYAEAFTEWYGSNGQTDNEFTLFVAGKEGWAERLRAAGYDEELHPRDARGRWAETEGRGGTTREGWEHVSTADATDRVAEMLRRQGVPAERAAGIATHLVPDDAYAMYGGPNGSQVIFTGDAQDTSLNQREHVLDVVSYMQESYPRENMTVVISDTLHDTAIHLSEVKIGGQPADPADTMVAVKLREDAAGATLGGSNIITITPSTFSEATERGYPSEAATFKPPAAAASDPIEYTIVHEWGHTLDDTWHVRSETLGDMARSEFPETRDRNVSTYAANNAPEAYAENFAEWVLSGGTTDVAVTKFYAEHEDWARPSLRAAGDYDEELHPRDERGRYAEKEGGDAPTGYTRLTPEARDERMTARLREVGMSADDIEIAMATMAAGSQPYAAYEGRNGMMVEFYPSPNPDEYERLHGTPQLVLTDNQQVPFLETADRLQQEWPRENMVIRVDNNTFDPLLAATGSKPDMADEPNTMGMTAQGSGFINVSPEVGAPYSRMVSEFNQRIEEAPRYGGSANQFPHSVEGHSAIEYVMTHEWGHTLDKIDRRAGPDSADSVNVFDDFVGEHGGGHEGYNAAHNATRDLSIYASTPDPAESFAEAFADWNFTGGEATNEWTQFVAAEMGWHKPTLTASVAFEYDPEQERDERGRWSKDGGTSAPDNTTTRATRAATDAMIEALRPDDGGFTIDPRNGASPQIGYAVAYRGMSSIMPAEQFFADPDAGRKMIEDHIRDHADFYDAHPDAMIGGWHDPVHQEIVLDPTKVVADRDEAIRLGTEQNQQAIADLGAIHRGDWDNAIIDTHGTGDREQIAATVRSTYGRNAEGAARGRVPPGQEDRRHDRRRGARARGVHLREDRRGALEGFRLDLTALIREAFEWDEEAHPRDEQGRFGEKGVTESAVEKTLAEMPDLGSYGRQQLDRIREMSDEHALANALVFWRGSFMHSSNMRAISRGDDPAPAYESDAYMRAMTHVIEGAIEQAEPIDTTYRSMNLPDSLKEGGTYEQGLMSVALTSSGTREYEQSDIFGHQDLIEIRNAPTVTMEHIADVLPPEKEQYRDTRSSPEGITSGRFRYEENDATGGKSLTWIDFGEEAKTAAGLAFEYDESQHERHPAGTPEGGQFAPKGEGGGGGGAERALPSGWTAIDATTGRSETLRMLRERGGIPHPEFMLDNIRPKDTYAEYIGPSGAHVMFTGSPTVSEADQAQFVAVVDGLQNDFPRDNVTVRVDEELFDPAIPGPGIPLGGREDVMGLTANGSNVITVSPDVFSAEHERLFERRAVEGRTVPSSPSVDLPEYVVTHEWAHTLDTADHSRSDTAALEYQMEYGVEDPWVSEYAASGYQEAWAEAFTEWQLSDGQTTDAQTIYYADHQHWDEPSRTGSVAFEYDPEQPRDEKGQWSKDGGSSSGERPSEQELADMYNAASFDRNEVRGYAERAEPIYKALGYDGAPRVVSRAELDRAAAESPVGLLHRVVANDEQAEEFRTGELFVGQGFQGTGTYTFAGTDEQFETFRTAFPIGYTGELHMTLAPDAKVLSMSRGEADEFGAEHRDLGAMGKDPGAASAAEGYDAIRIHAGIDTHVLVLNREKVIVAEAERPWIGITDTPAVEPDEVGLFR